MKVLLNTTTCRTGGSLQTSSAFIIEALRDRGEIEWHFAAPRSGANELEQLGVPLPAGMTIIDKTPVWSLTARRQLRELEARLQPDCVLTFSGPAYVRFRSFHVVGCSTPWVTHPTWVAFRSLDTLGYWTGNILRTTYKRLWFRYADAWVVQTETSARGLARRLGFPPERITIISNTCGELYRGENNEKPFPAPGQPVKILVFSAPYKHKNFELLPLVARELAARRPDLDFKIIVTIAPQNRVCRDLMASIQKLGVAKWIENVGPVPVVKGPDMYRAADICFLPTLLETFSATYPEAMAMGLPIVTTDLDFAHDICDDAALYFRPKDAKSAVDCLVRLLGDENLWRRQIARGKEVVQRFPTPRERYEAYVRMLLSFRDVIQASAARQRSRGATSPSSV